MIGRRTHTQLAARRPPPGPHQAAQGRPAVLWRTRALLVFFLLCFALLLYRVVTLMVLEDPQLDERIASQYESVVVLQPKRGSITDRRGKALAVSVTLDSVFADPALIDDPAEVASQLAPVLGLPPGELEQKLRLERRFVWLLRQVDPAVSEGVRALKLRGVRVTPEAKRTYPAGRAAGQLLGFVGTDGNGLEGLEARYDQLLMGEEETYVALRDGRRRNITPEGVVVQRSTEGHSLRLSIDQRLQFIAEEALGRAVDRYEPRSAFAIVMDPFTGDVLALANAPWLDPNEFGRYARASYRDHGVADTFEPGSTMKPFVMALALDAGVVEPGEVIDCERGRYRIGRNTIHDTHEYEDLTVEEIIQVSSNIGAAKIAERLGAERLHDGFARCGFGRKTGIDLTGESAGLFRDWRSWRRIGLATHAFGQGLSVTGIQLAMALSAVANGGALMQPRVILDVTDRDGRVVDTRDPVVVDHPFGPEAAATVRRMMGLVVQEGGTGTLARLDDYTCGGKTGTAQKVNPETGRYDRSLWVSSFIGFAPLENPRIVVVVVVDEPHGKHYGGTVAGPVFKEIATRSLKTMGVPPLVDAIAELPIEPPPQPAEIDVPATVVSTDGAAGVPLEMVASELTDELDGAAAMPDLGGVTLRAALRRLGDRDLDIRVEGSGLLVEQSPPPGVPLRGGDEVVLSFDEGDGT